MTPEEAIEILWEYHHVKQELRPADLIFILGSNDVRVAEYAAELYARKLAPLLLFSGGMGRFTGEWAVPEAELFAEAAMKKGVPEDRILNENKSTNTGENVRFSRTIKTTFERYGEEYRSWITQRNPCACIPSGGASWR